MLLFRFSSLPLFPSLAEIGPSERACASREAYLRELGCGAGGGGNRGTSVVQRRCGPCAHGPQGRLLARKCRAGGPTPTEGVPAPLPFLVCQSPPRAARGRLARGRHVAGWLVAGSVFEVEHQSLPKVTPNLLGTSACRRRYFVKLSFEVRNTCTYTVNLCGPVIFLYQWTPLTEQLGILLLNIPKRVPPIDALQDDKAQKGPFSVNLSLNLTGRIARLIRWGYIRRFSLWGKI
eukprot:SAG11_NODE_55_length_19449_cov_28.630135_14_plen_234_part_00